MSLPKVEFPEWSRNGQAKGTSEGQESWSQWFAFTSEVRNKGSWGAESWGHTLGDSLTVYFFTN